MVKIETGFFDSPFGKCFIAFSDLGVMALIFEEDELKAISDLQKRFGLATFENNESRAHQLGIQIFREKKNIQLDLRGTDFQRKVWETLLQIPSGQTATYKEIAALAGNPEAVRATGTAIGANPVAWYIPCHRVIRSDRKPGGYRWGLPLKKKMLLSEGVACSW